MKVFALISLLFAGVPVDLPFKPWFTSRGVEVEIARVRDGPPWIRGTAEIPAPARRIADVVTDFSNYREIFSPAVKKAKVLEAGERSARLHIVWPYPFPLRNRDAIIAYRLETLPEGEFLLSWRDDQKPGDPREGVRIKSVAGETYIVPLEPDRSRVTYTYLGDLGGKFPKSAEEKAWRAEPVEYFRALRRWLGGSGDRGPSTEARPTAVGSAGSARR